MIHKLMVYIYSLIDPRTNEVRYVGKSVTPEKRLIAHVCTTHVDSNPHKLNWIKELKREGLRPTLIILEETTGDLWPEREKYWISFQRSLGNNLTNLADGGLGGGSPSEETKKLIGQKTSERMKDLTIRDHLREVYGRKIVRSDGFEYGSIKLVADDLKVQQQTIRKYIENGDEINGFKYYWINYNPKRARTNNSKIRCVETKEEYNSILEASIILKTNRQAIRESLKYGLKVKGNTYEYVDKSKVNQSANSVVSIKCMESGKLVTMDQLIQLTKMSSRNIHNYIRIGLAIRGLHYEKVLDT